MSDSKAHQISDWIRKTFRQTPDRVLIRTRHIEKDRIWREISESDVRKVIKNGKVFSVRSSDKTILWRGIDTEGRELELQCAIVSVSGVDTLVVQEAEKVRVGTAYEPYQNDASLKKQWLADHPKYEELPNGKVQRRISITRI